MKPRDHQSNSNGAHELSAQHQLMLEQGSAISPEVIAERGYWTASRWQDLEDLVPPFRGGQKASERFPALVIPQYGPDGEHTYCVIRPDRPRTLRAKVVKYEQPAGTGLRLDLPRRCAAGLRDRSRTLWITEGAKKADSLASLGLVAINTPGVDGWRAPSGIPDLYGVPFKERTVVIAYDSDVLAKASVRRAVEALARWLRQKGAVIEVLDWQRAEPPGESKLGVDDYLAGGRGGAELEALRVPLDEWLAAAADEPQVRILAAGPPVLDRPLALVDGRAYAVTWLWVETTREYVRDEETGELTRCDPPEVDQHQACFVVRDDGTLFGPGGDAPLADLGLRLELPSPVREARLWRAPAVETFRTGARPDPAAVFRHVAAVFDHYIDFSRSLATQSMMCEMSACFSLATWFAAVFSVVGYPWPNGDRGSGKTNWGICWAYMSYLGEVVLASGTFAALRDLAHYGAALLFDDAENLSNPKQADPDKRALLLAGNRRGAMVPLKELIGKTWVTRWVNAYGPRAFTAISVPDAVLASRSVVIPLVRTGDSVRGNRDPADLDRWPCDHRALQDTLWAIALSLVPEAARVWAELDAETSAIGRELEPWRAVLAVARLFERHGVAGLEGRMREVMRAYQSERVDLIGGSDRTALVIRALFAVATSGRVADVSDVSAMADVLIKEAPEREVQTSAAIVTEQVKVLLEADGDGGADWATDRAVGRVLQRLRVPVARTPDRKRTKIRRISVGALLGLAAAYGLVPRSVAADDAVDDPNEPSFRSTASAEMSETSALGAATALDGNGLAGNDGEADEAKHPSNGELWPADSFTGIPDEEVLEWTG
jgi:hypothetical protein